MMATDEGWDQGGLRESEPARCEPIAAAVLQTADRSYVIFSSCCRRRQRRFVLLRSLALNSRPPYPSHQQPNLIMLCSPPGGVRMGVTWGDIAIDFSSPRRGTVERSNRRGRRGEGRQRFPTAAKDEHVRPSLPAILPALLRCRHERSEDEVVAGCMAPSQDKLDVPWRRRELTTRRPLRPSLGEQQTEFLST